MNRGLIVFYHTNGVNLESVYIIDALSKLLCDNSVDMVNVLSFPV